MMFSNRCGEDNPTSAYTDGPATGNWQPATGNRQAVSSSQ
jgi:hypothetical protein